MSSRFTLCNGWILGLLPKNVKNISGFIKKYDKFASDGSWYELCIKKWFWVLW